MVPADPRHRSARQRGLVEFTRDLPCCISMLINECKSYRQIEKHVIRFSGAGCSYDVTMLFHTPKPNALMQ
jgi:hypothetical protein